MIEALINASRKWLKIFLILRIRKISFSIAPIFGICIKFLDLLFFDWLNEFITISLVLLLLLEIT